MNKLGYFKFEIYFGTNSQAVPFVASKYCPQILVRQAIIKDLLTQ
jgi:hypothetical protein